jgi:hypothetical protein
MKNLTLAVVLALAVPMTGCALKKGQQQNKQVASTSEQRGVQTENKDQDAQQQAINLTNGWPESSMTAAKEIISKYGAPTETTSNALIWRNVAPFREIIVHKEVFDHRFPLLHQNSVQHVVDYKAVDSKVDDIWRYNGSIVLDRTKGQMSSFAQNEAMNILSLNLAHDVMTGKLSADAARVQFGKETLAYINGKRDANTTVLSFGSQIQTADQGESVTNKIRWVGDPAYQRNNTRQAQEEK